MYVIDDPELPKNEREWAYSKPRPYKISMTAERHSLVFHDPAIDLYMQMGGPCTRKPLTAAKKDSGR